MEGRQGNAFSSWPGTACGLVRIERPELDGWATDPKRTIQTTVFDSSDGVSSHSLALYSPRVAKSSDGKIWYLTLDGVSVIDPRHLPFNNCRRRSTSRRSSPMTRPTLHRRNCICPLRLAISRSTLPRSTWRRRRKSAFATSWRPGSRLAGRGQSPASVLYKSFSGNYRFRVIASTNSGVWNETGVILPFSIARLVSEQLVALACVADFLLMLWALCQLRLRQLAQQFNITMEARSMSGFASRGSCTILCCKAFRHCCSVFEPFATCFRAVQEAARRPPTQTL
jgi:hypothetical protein